MEKRKQLQDYIGQFRKVALAYSGGVDSSVLLRAAIDAIGRENSLAITAVTPLHGKREIADAAAFCKAEGIMHVPLAIDAFSVPEICKNTRDRCYHCKLHIFRAIIEEAHERGFSAVFDGTNTDDLLVYRPGLRALSELSVISPLRACGIDKKTVREIARDMGLPQYKKPAGPCFATRVPYDTEVTREIIARIESGEEAIKETGVSDCRLRHHGELARIEVPRAERDIILNNEQITNKLKALGYRFVTIDTEGLRSGSFDE